MDKSTWEMYLHPVDARGYLSLGISIAFVGINEPKKFKKILIFIEYLIKSPSKDLSLMVDEVIEGIKLLRRPKIWFNIWVISLISYLYVVSNDIKLNHLLVFIISLLVIEVWYVWVKGDWVRDARLIGKL